MATVNDSPPIKFFQMRNLMKKMSVAQEAMMAHAAAGCPEKGFENSFMVRVTLRDLQVTIEHALKEDSDGQSNVQAAG